MKKARRSRAKKMKRKLKSSPSTDQLVTDNKVMRSATAKFNRWFSAAGLFVAGLFLSGCGHLYYADPNPSQPYAFPGSTPNRATPMTSASVGTQATAYQPGSVQPVLPSNPALPSGQNTPVAVAPTTGLPQNNSPAAASIDNAGGSSL